MKGKRCKGMTPPWGKWLTSTLEGRGRAVTRLRMLHTKCLHFRGSMQNDCSCSAHTLQKLFKWIQAYITWYGNVVTLLTVSQWVHIVMSSEMLTCDWFINCNWHQALSWVCHTRINFKQIKVKKVFFSTRDKIWYYLASDIAPKIYVALRFVLTLS